MLSLSPYQKFRRTKLWRLEGYMWNLFTRSSHRGFVTSAACPHLKSQQAQHTCLAKKAIGYPGMCERGARCVAWEHFYSMQCKCSNSASHLRSLSLWERVLVGEEDVLCVRPCPLRSTPRPPRCPCHLFPQRGFWPPLTISHPLSLGKQGPSSCGDHSPVFVVTDLWTCEGMGVQPPRRTGGECGRPGFEQLPPPPPRLSLALPTRIPEWNCTLRPMWVDR